MVMAFGLRGFGEVLGIVDGGWGFGKECGFERKRM